MTISIETYGDCPHCGEHVLYHCETPEKISECRWMKEREKNASDTASNISCQNT